MSRITRSNGLIIVQPEGNIMSAGAEAFRDELMRLVSQNDAELAIDLSRVKRIDSVGMGVFISIFNTLKKREKKLQVINASRKIHSLFQTMGLTRRFKVTERGVS